LKEGGTGAEDVYSISQVKIRKGQVGHIWGKFNIRGQAVPSKLAEGTKEGKGSDWDQGLTKQDSGIRENTGNTFWETISRMGGKR